MFPLYSQFQIEQICGYFLERADIIISHNSPYGIHDKKHISHIGYRGLLSYIEKYKSKFCIHGHQQIDKRTKYLDTEVIGVIGASILETTTGKIEKIF